MAKYNYPYVPKTWKVSPMLVKLFILGLPGSGKSAIARSIVDYVNHQQISGQSDQQWSAIRFNDYPILLEMFHQDIEGKRFKRAEPDGFDMLDPNAGDEALQALEIKVFDEALQALEQKVDAQINLPEPDQPKFIIIEFSRNNYEHAFEQFNRSFLTDVYFLYLHAGIEVCKERIRRRVAEPQFEEDDHPVSDYIFENYYYGDDAEHLIKILMHEYQVDKKRILVVKNNGSVEEALGGVNRFVDVMLVYKTAAQSVSRSILEGDESK
jgi:adenylate kinase family enzyme